MRFAIYIRRHGMLHKLFKFQRSVNGLYIVSSRQRDAYTSYHEDGRYWVRSAGQKTVKSVREPLRAFRGSETLMVGYAVFDEGPSPLAIDPATVRLRPEDIVLDYEGERIIVGIEVILSDRALEPPPLPERLRPRVFTIEGQPLLILEAFTLAGNQLSGYRFYRAPREFHYGENIPPRI